MQPGRDVPSHRVRHGGTRQGGVLPVRLAALGIRDFAGLVPSDLFSWANVLTARGFLLLGVGGFLVGFGSAYAGECTSGHAIMGLADLQLPFLAAVIGFFAGGLITTHVLLPLILGGGLP